METVALWEKLRGVPDWAKKKITGGRLSGMTDIKPQWRYQRLTEEFGPCGIGWRFTIDKQWIEVGANNELSAFVNVSLFVKINDEWSHPIPGNGGSMFVSKERNGLHTSDEAFKMATTDAIGTAAKMLGLAADVYNGGNHDSKYSEPEQETNFISEDEANRLNSLIAETGTDINKFLAHYKIKTVLGMPKAKYQGAINILNQKIKEAA